jgi:hypothetical protein
MSETQEERERRQKAQAELETLCPGFFDWRELTEEEIERTVELAKRHGWEKSQ